MVTLTKHIFDIETQQWTAGPNMNHIRRAHGCATFEIQGKSFAIIGGGYDDNVYLNSVEFLDIEDRSEWIEGIIELSFLRVTQP